MVMTATSPGAPLDQHAEPLPEADGTGGIPGDEPERVEGAEVREDAGLPRRGQQVERPDAQHRIGADADMNLRLEQRRERRGAVAMRRGWKGTMRHAKPAGATSGRYRSSETRTA